MVLNWSQVIRLELKLCNLFSIKTFKSHSEEFVLLLLFLNYRYCKSIDNLFSLTKNLFLQPAFFTSLFV